MKALHALPICVVAIASVAIVSAAEPNTLEWRDHDGVYRELLAGERPIVRYMYEPLDESSSAARERTYKPYLHVFAPDGTTLLTKGPGGLYPHHRGIFYGFNKIRYGNGKSCDTWHCTNGAYQSHQEFLECDVDEHGVARLKVRINWHGNGGEVFASEVRTMLITPDTTPGDEALEVDFYSTLTPTTAEPIHLDGDPQHAGVQFRAAQHVADTTAKETYYLRTSGKGKPGETRNWDHGKEGDPMNAECSNRPWNTLSFVVDGQRYSVLYLDAPSNPKPSRYSERDYGRFGSYFVADATRDQPLEVHYTFLIAPGEMTLEECQSLYQDFAQPPGTPPGR